MRAFIEIFFGILLLVLGFIGGLIPLLQGWVLGIPGLILLSKHFPPAKKLLNWIKSRLKSNKVS